MYGPQIQESVLSGNFPQTESLVLLNVLNKLNEAWDQFLWLFSLGVESQQVNVLLAVNFVINVNAEGNVVVDEVGSSSGNDVEVGVQ